MMARIEFLEQKLLVGRHLSMSLAANRTFELWSSFMPLRRLIANNVGSELYSMQVYQPQQSMRAVLADTVFEKWAAVEVSDDRHVPAGMELFTLPAGSYAVFLHKGAASAGEQTFRYIFGTWLPASIYEIDDRPHFELLGARYKHDSDTSEEEIWIPVRERRG